MENIIKKKVIQDRTNKEIQGKENATKEESMMIPDGEIHERDPVEESVGKRSEINDRDSIEERVDIYSSQSLVPEFIITFDDNEPCLAWLPNEYYFIHVGNYWVYQTRIIIKKYHV